MTMSQKKMSEGMSFIIPSAVENLQLADPSLLNFYADLEERTYYLIDEININTLDLVQYILRWNREDKDLAPDARKPIRLIITCPGGDLDIEQTIVSIIKLSKTPVYGYAMGCVASAASVIYLACHKRFALPNTYFVLHKGSCQNVSGSYNDVVAMINDYMSQIDEMIEFYKQNTKYSADQIEANINTDWYVRADEALEYGLVDEIIADIDMFYGGRT